MGGLVKEPEPPKLEGFVFTGWYKDASCTQKWDFASDKVAGNTTLYAGWKYDYQPASFPEDMTRRVLLRPGGPVGHGGPAQQGSPEF